METKNIIKLLGVSIIAAMFLLPASSALTNDVADVSISVKGGLGGIQFSVENERELSVDATYRVIGKTPLNYSGFYDITVTTECEGKTTTTFPAEIPGDLAIICVEFSCLDYKIRRYGFAFNGMAFIPWIE